MRQSGVAKATGDQFTLKQRPFAALAAGVRFLSNIQETSYFFELTDAIDGGQQEANYQRYLKTPVGAKLDAEGVNLYDVLADKAFLSKQPKGSLAQIYLEFMSVEDLLMDELLAAEIKAKASTLKLNPSRRRFMESGIALHDVYHVLTGYNRSPIGEACVLTFTAEQFSLRGVAMIARGLGLREQIRFPRMPVLAMLEEAKRIARDARWLAEADWREALARPIDEVRKSFGVAAPAKYLRWQSPATPRQAPAGLPHAA